MKRIINTTLRLVHRYYPLTAALILTLLPARTGAVPAELLFEDDFTQGIPGWTAVQPSGAISWLRCPALAV